MYACKRSIDNIITIHYSSNKNGDIVQNMSRKSPHVLLKVSFEKMFFSAVLKILIVALALILFGSVFQAFAADTVNDRTTHELLDSCSVNSSLFAERIFPRSGSYGLTWLHK